MVIVMVKVVVTVDDGDDVFRDDDGDNDCVGNGDDVDDRYHDGGGAAFANTVRNNICIAHVAYAHVCICLGTLFSSSLFVVLVVSFQ